ncbi:tetratricopeptide repeat protein, partial [Fibrobacterota bacterium]
QTWSVIKGKSLEQWASVSIYGFKKDQAFKVRSRGTLVFQTSGDSVGAPIFYRDVPIMPSKNDKGEIKPLSKAAQRLIKWRLRDVSLPKSRVVMEKIHSCANCHSFSSDGKWLGMDIDGPQGDKGAYGLLPLEKEMTVEKEDLISWNYGFKDKPKGKKTLGFMSQVSPDGKYVITTVNESIFVVNYMKSDFIQVFYPTRGILAWYNRDTGRIKALPGADDSSFVHCTPVWTPDGKDIVFARAPAGDPYVKEQKMPAHANAPEETPIQYSLYRMPFNDGRGGRAVPIEGASDNNMSNNFPKVTPDGRFVVFVKCRNGLLMRPDSRLWIVPLEGGPARQMRCNTSKMNSWHSFSPNGRWMVFSSKAFSPFTQMFLTHIDEEGNDTPPILIPKATADNRAVNIPEFVNIAYGDLNRITMPAVNHFKHLIQSRDYVVQNKASEAWDELRKALKAAGDDAKFKAEVLVIMAWMREPYGEGPSYMKLAIKTDPEYTNAHFDLGIMYQKQGKEKEAFECYRKTLELTPDDPWSMGRLASLHVLSRDSGLRDPARAVSLAEKANELSYYRQEPLLRTLARVYSEVGRFPEAVKTAEKALDIAVEKEGPQEVRGLREEIRHYTEGRPFHTMTRKKGS